MLQRRIYLLFLFSIFLFGTSFANETPESLARKLQDQLLASPGVSLSFTIASEGHIHIIADTKANHIRVESPSLLILSDGRSVWNYDKKIDQVTVDNVGPTSSYKEASALFRFADNYTATIVKTEPGDHYTLELTPSQKLQSLLKAAGNMQKLVLDVKKQGKRWKIVSARAASSRGATETQGLKIESLRTLRASDFVFKPKASTKVIDIRD